MNPLWTSLVLAFLAAEPLPPAEIQPQAGGPSQAQPRPYSPPPTPGEPQPFAEPQQVRNLTITLPPDPEPQGEAEQRLAAFYADRIQNIPWEWDEAKSLLSTSIQTANQLGFDVNISSPANNFGRLEIELRKGKLLGRATVHWNTPFVIVGDHLIYVDFDPHHVSANLVKVNLAGGDVVWSRRLPPFMRGVGGSTYGRQFRIQLTGDAVILTGQDNHARFHYIRSLSTGTALAFRVYPWPDGAP
jgi:hypothetical protein